MPGPADSPSAGARTAAFFDLDKTIIAKSSTLALGRSFYQGGLINRRAVLKGSYAHFVYLVAGADHDQMNKMRDHLAAMSIGWEVEQVTQIVTEALHELINPLIYAEAAELIDDHHAHGRDVIIISSSGAEVVGPIAEMLGADDYVATRMTVADGRYTGEMEYYAYGPFKAEAIQQLADERGYDLSQCYAYSDSETDLPMLEAVGHPTAVNPDKALRRAALENGWPVREFRRPMALRDRLSRINPPTTPVMAGGAFVALAATAGVLAWALLRRQGSSAP